SEHLLGKGDMLFLPPGSSRLCNPSTSLVVHPHVVRFVWPMTSAHCARVISSVAFSLEDHPAVGGGSDKFIARDRGWSALGGERSGTVLATRSALTGSNRPV